MASQNLVILVPQITCCQFDTKQFNEPMLTYSRRFQNVDVFLIPLYARHDIWQIEYIFYFFFQTLYPETQFIETECIYLFRNNTNLHEPCTTYGVLNNTNTNTINTNTTNTNTTTKNNNDNLLLYRSWLRSCLLFITNESGVGLVHCTKISPVLVAIYEYDLKFRMLLTTKCNLLSRYMWIINTCRLVRDELAMYCRY